MKRAREKPKKISKISRVLLLLIFLLSLSSIALAEPPERSLGSIGPAGSDGFYVPAYTIDYERFSADDYLNLLEQVFWYVYNNYVDEVDPKTLLEGALHGLLDSLDDPYSTYLDAKDMERTTDITLGKYGGIGISIIKQIKGDRLNPSLNREEESSYVRVISPIEGTPAHRSGILPGDLIIEIEEESTIDMTADEVIDKLRGLPGTEVKIKILRGADIEFDVVLTREIIEVPTVKKAIIPPDIGYLRITEFTLFTPDRVEEALKYFERGGYTSLIIDVRNNPGGLLSSAVDTADLFLSGGIIVSTRSRIASENMDFMASEETKVSYNIPIVVLINKGSASASEILAGALKDRGRAYLIGEETYGKGSVQRLNPLGPGGFRLTTARYFTPSDANIDMVGITPHKIVKEYELTEDEQKSYQEIIKNNISKIYDLEYDTVLREAVKVLKRQIEKCPF
ncbi:MAG: S41 family peptidase [Spirochaetes bacterium]|nr:MAG: S41 family peptidase [Spirochaetota bacterium]